MKKSTVLLLTAGFLSISGMSSYAQTPVNDKMSQDSTVKLAPKKHPFVVNLSEDGKQYIKFGMNVQLWARNTSLNPGSTVGSDVMKDAYDIAIRRLRLQAFGMLTKKVFFHFQVGQNNINLTQNTNPYNAPLSILDLLGEYHFNTKFQLGGGLCGWGAGTTRYSSQSSSSQLSLDSPIYQQNANISSTYGNRNLSIYAKGQVGKINYRVAVTDPYKIGTAAPSASASISPLTPKPQYLAMVTYNFFDTESNTEAYTKGTYLGTKKVLNIAAGYMFEQNAMWSRATATSDTVRNNMQVFGADIFYDSPINSKGAAITLYGAYNNCNYGKNYTRSIATPNPATNSAPTAPYSAYASNGTGSGFIGIGTGNIFYAQAGYLFNKNKNEDKKGRAQIYATSEVAVLQALKTPMTMIEAGINYYLTGTFGPKISLGYQNRSLFKTVTGETQQVLATRKGMLVLQYQYNF